ncbi:unnamed protein product, partial [Mesorhabditis spiculigera]
MPWNGHHRRDAQRHALHACHLEGYPFDPGCTPRHDAQVAQESPAPATGVWSGMSNLLIPHLHNAQMAQRCWRNKEAAPRPGAPERIENSSAYRAPQLRRQRHGQLRPREEPCRLAHLPIPFRLRPAAMDNKSWREDILRGYGIFDHELFDGAMMYSPERIEDGSVYRASHPGDNGVTVQVTVKVNATFVRNDPQALHVLDLLIRR